jgi:hypothetical protein
MLGKLSVFLITAALVAGMVGCDSGEQPPSQDLEIRTWSDLDAIRDNLDGNHTLMNELDRTTPGYTGLAGQTAHGGRGWEPIDNFRGTLDGQGYEIRDLFIDRPHENYAGLFGFVDRGGVIQNIGVANATVIGADYVAGLVAESAYGVVSNCYFAGSVTGEDGVGGLIGGNWGTVSNSYASGNITGAARVGGLVGVNAATVSNSYSTVNVTSAGTVGGLVGDNMGAIYHSFWDTETSGQTPSAGGRGKSTAEMKNLATFSGAYWNIIAVADSGTRNTGYIWNIVDGETYPFLSWQVQTKT